MADELEQELPENDDLLTPPADDADTQAPEDDPEAATEETAEEAEPTPAANEPDPEYIAWKQQREAEKNRLAARTSTIEAEPEVDAETAEILAKLDTGEIDPLEDGPRAFKAMRAQQKAIEAENKRLREERQEQARNESAWRTWAAKNRDIPLDQARNIFEEEFEKALKKYPKADVANGVASENWERRINAKRAQKPRATRPAGVPPVPAPLVRGTKTPPVASARQPVPIPKSFDEKVERFARSAAGGLDGLVS